MSYLLQFADVTTSIAAQASAYCEAYALFGRFLLVASSDMLVP